MLMAAGFGYEFNALTPRAEGEAGDELAEAFADIFSTARKFRIMTILQVWFPLLRRFVSLSCQPRVGVVPCAIHKR